MSDDDDDPWSPDWDGPKPKARLGRPARGGAPRTAPVDPGPLADPLAEFEGASTPHRKPLLPPKKHRPARPVRRSRGGFFRWLALFGLPLPVLAVASLVGVALLRGATLESAVLAGTTLVVLPMLAFVAAFRGHGFGFAVAVWAWPALLILGLPLYFPGERADALSEGVAWLALPLGEERSQQAGKLAGELGALLGDSAATTPATPAEEVTPDPEPASAAEEPDEPGRTVLPIEGEGRHLKVEVRFEGPDQEAVLPVLFDTGATFTTLDRGALTALGVPIPTDAPTARFQTANGEMESPMVLVPRLWLADRPIEHVTVAVCDACAQNGSYGLLGLNVTGQFQVTVDNELAEVVLVEREDGDRHLDVAHWLQISAVARRWPTGRVEIELTARNRAPIEVSEAVVEVECASRSFAVQLDQVPAGGSGETTVSLPRDVECGEYSVVLRSGRW